MKYYRVLSLLGLFASSSFVSAQTFYSAAGPTPASIQSAVDSFKTALGPLNSNVAGSFGTGRREINWDGVPDSLSSPNNFPANFFNVNSPRGVVFATPGTGFATSASTSSGTPVEFGNIDPSFPALFQPFSPQRLFTAVGSNLIDVSFFIAGSNTAAFTTGFGAVFSDVDLANTTSLQFFGAGNLSLGTYFVPAATGNETLSFLGVLFNDAVVSRVRITSGNGILAPGNSSSDLVALDDFIYGEPRLQAAVSAVPEASATAFSLGGGLLIILAFYRRYAARSQRVASQ